MADQQVTKSEAKGKQKYYVRDRQVIKRPAQDVKEALLGGKLVPFKFLLII